MLGFLWAGIAANWFAPGCPPGSQCVAIGGGQYRDCIKYLSDIPQSYKDLGSSGVTVDTWMMYNVPGDLPCESVIPSGWEKTGEFVAVTEAFFPIGPIGDLPVFELPYQLKWIDIQGKKTGDWATCCDPNRTDTSLPGDCAALEDLQAEYSSSPYYGSLRDSYYNAICESTPTTTTTPHPG